MAARKISRRRFLQQTAGVAAGVVLVPGLAARAAKPALAAAGPADLILTNANVITMHAARPEAQAVAIAGGRILAAGSNEQAMALAGPATRVRDLAGQTLIPGLYDSHNHMLSTGLNLSAVDLSGTKSLDDVLKAIGDRAAETPPGDWVMSSSRWHEGQLAENRFPTRWELDAVAPNNPVLIRRGGHNIVVNSIALQMAGLNRDTPNPPEGTYVRNADGDLTGHIIESVAFGPILRLLPPTTNEDRLHALRSVLRLYREVGITSVIEPGLQPVEMATYRALADSGELTTRTSMMWRFAPGTTPGSLQQALDTLASGVVTRNLDDPWLRTIAIKMLGDGGVETGYYREPYAFTDDPAHPRGKPSVSQENLVAFLTEAARRDWQVGIHCVGDAAIDNILAAYEATNAVVPITDKRWTIIHMMAARPEHWGMINKLKLAVTAQQPLMYALAVGFLKYIGPERARDIEPMQAYLANIKQPVGGGSDSPVTPYQPMTGIWSSVTRSTDLVGTQGPQWGITPAQALQMYTINSAWCASEEDVKGSIEPGKYADLVALSADPRTVEPDAIKDIQAMVTIVDGKVVFDREHDVAAQAVPYVRITGPVQEGCGCQHFDDE